MVNIGTGIKNKSSIVIAVTILTGLIMNFDTASKCKEIEINENSSINKNELYNNKQNID